MFELVLPAQAHDHAATLGQRFDRRADERSDFTGLRGVIVSNISNTGDGRRLPPFLFDASALQMVQRAIARGSVQVGANSSLDLPRFTTRPDGKEHKIGRASCRERV